MRFADPDRRRGPAALMRALLCLLLAAASIAAYLHLPATWSLHALGDRIDPLALADVHGSAWNGEARRSWWGETAMGWLSWHADPVPALGGTLRAQLHFRLPREQTVDAHAAWTADRLRVDALHADLLGSALQRFFRTIDLQPIGQLRVEVVQALFDGGVPIALRGHAVWRQATLLGPRVPVFLGDVRVDFRTQSPGVVVGVIRDLGGPVRVTGSLRMNLVGYRIDMEASARDPLLAASLSKFGDPLADGSRRLLLQAVWWWRKPRDAGATNA
jgi:hypothetical protein